MFDILNYNIYLAFGAFSIFFASLMILFKSKLLGVFDPFVSHLLWLSGNLAFLVVFHVKYGLSYMLMLFYLIFIIYIYLIKTLLPSIKFNHKEVIEAKNKLSEKKILCLYITSIFILLFSKKPVFEYMIETNYLQWFLYRFKSIEGGLPLYRVLSVGVSPIFLYLSFFNIWVLKRFRVISVFALIMFSFLSIMTGGRSFLLSFIFSLGGFFTLHRNSLIDTIKLKKWNLRTYFAITLAMGVAIFVSSMFDDKTTFKDGIQIILNRVIASADGLEYYIKYDGFKFIENGFIEFFLSIFGLYFKSFLEIEYKNIGHQLTELATGGNIDFAQGSNYTLPLQVMVIGYWFMPFYLLIISILVSKMRNVKAILKGKIELIKYFIFMNFFSIVGDIEFFVFKMFSFLIVYFSFFYPIIKLKFWKI